MTGWVHELGVDPIQERSIVTTKLEREGYPGLAHHRRQHAVFLDKVERLYNRATAGRASFLELLYVVRDLLHDHVADADVRYATWLQTR